MCLIRQPGTAAECPRVPSTSSTWLCTSFCGIYKQFQHKMSLTVTDQLQFRLMGTLSTFQLVSENTRYSKSLENFSVLIPHQWQMSITHKAAVSWQYLYACYKWQCLDQYSRFNEKNNTKNWEATAAICFWCAHHFATFSFLFFLWSTIISNSFAMANDNLCTSNYVWLSGENFCSSLEIYNKLWDNCCYYFATMTSATY